MRSSFICIIFLLCVAGGLFSCNHSHATRFQSTYASVAVNLPEGWAAADGPVAVARKSIEGLVAFNSWGQPDFWATEKQNGNSFTYSPAILMAQIPDGGAYVVLLEIGGPMSFDNPEEYKLNDLSGLYQPHDWRQDEYYYKSFYKNSKALTLTVACSQNATDQTVAQINALLKSWRFTSPR